MNIISSLLYKDDYSLERAIHWSPIIKVLVRMKFTRPGIDPATPRIISP